MVEATLSTLWWIVNLRVFANFFNKIKDFDKSKPVKLAYGSAKFNPTGKGEVAVPTTGAFKECSYQFPMVLVDEYLTTKISRLLI